MDDSDLDEEPTPQNKKLTKPLVRDTGESLQEKEKVKPQIAKKLRKQRRQQKLLQKLDKEAYQNSQTNVNAALDESSPAKKRKNAKHEAKLNNGVEVDEVEENDTDAQGQKSGGGRPYTVSIAVAGSGNLNYVVY